MARREHTARHGQQMVDAIAAQMRVYAAATVDPRWQAQLSALGAQVWWDHDDHYVDVLGERQNLDRAAAIDHLLDLLHLLRILPPIEPTGPFPGAAQQAWQTDTEPGRRRRSADARPGAGAACQGRVHRLPGGGGDLHGQGAAIDGALQHRPRAARRRRGWSGQAHHPAHRHRQSLRGAQIAAAAGGRRGQPLPRRVARSGSASPRSSASRPTSTRRRCCSRRCWCRPPRR